MVILHLVTIDLTSTASRPVKSLKTDVAVLDGSTKTVSHKNEVAPKKTPQKRVLKCAGECPREDKARVHCYSLQSCVNQKL